MLRRCAITAGAFTVRAHARYAWPPLAQSAEVGQNRRWLSSETPQQKDVVVVGAGFGGLCQLHRLRNDGFDTQVVDAADDVGGTWYWNRYPGARCDVESIRYSYQFDEQLQQDWNWTERYAAQPEILSYINHAADRFGLRSDIAFKQRVKWCEFNETTRKWTVETSDHKYEAPYVVLATGCLSAPLHPRYPGMESYEGAVYYTSSWPHKGVSFEGQSVAVVGTGSSGIQSIPEIAREAKKVTVYQRTANYSVPAHNRPLDPEYVADVKSRYAEIRAHDRMQPFGMDIGMGDRMFADMTRDEFVASLSERWSTKGGFSFLAATPDQVMNQEADNIGAQFVRDRIHEQVENRAVAEMLSPRHPLACKRLCVDTGYYETYNRDNVELVSISPDGTPIATFTKTGIRTADASLREHDAVVFACGFDAMTGAAVRIDVRGRNGQTLRDKWERDGAKAYLGVQTAGFPNFFFITGPQSPSVLSNMVPSVEQDANFIADLIGYAQKNEKCVIETTPEAQEQWVQHCNEVANMTVFAHPSCNSWYLGSNVTGKKRNFLPYLGVNNYIAQTEKVAQNGYEGFQMSS